MHQALLVGTNYESNYFSLKAVVSLPHTFSIGFVACVMLYYVMFVLSDTGATLSLSLSRLDYTRTY